MAFKKLIPRKVASKVLIVGGFLALTTGASIGWLSYFTTENIISDRMQKVEVINLLSEKTSKIQEVINSAVKVSQLLATNQNLNSWFNQKERSGRQKKQVLELLRYIANDLKYPIVFAINAKTNHYWTQKQDKSKTLSPDKQEDQWFYETLKKPAGTVILDLDDSEFLGGTYIFINVLMGKPGAKSTGVAGIGFPIEHLIKEFIEHHYDKHAKVQLVNQQGIIQVSENKKLLGKNIKEYLPYKIAKKIFLPKEGTVNLEYHDPDVGDIIVGAKHIEGTHWLTIVEIAKDSWLFSTLKPIQMGIVYSGLLAIGIISILVGFITKSRVSQLISISKAIDALGNNDFSANLEPKVLERHDEVGDMARGYDRTRKNLYNAYQENEKILKGLEDTITARTHEIQHINDVARAINSTLNFDDIILTLLDKLQEVIPFNQLGIFMLKESQTELRVSNYAGEGISPSKLADIKQISIPISKENLIGRALLDEQPQYIEIPNEEAIDQLSETGKALYQANPVKSYFALPLVVQRKVIGTILLANTKQVMNIDEDSQNKVLRYVVQISNAIQNAQLFSDLKSTRLQLLETEKIAEMTKAFERFVPKQFLNRLAKTGVEDVKVGMVQCTFITVLFSDIRSFTNLSESMTPQDLLLFLNRYLVRMNEVIAKNSGFIDKFIGDAIMAIFDENNEGNKEQDAHFNEAHMAVQCAIQMHQSLNEYNQERSANNELPVEIGIGLHSGPVVVGTVGSEDRLQTTVLGDTVNAAARLESITKLYGAKIVISDQTYQFIKSETKFLVRPLDYLQVKGKEEAMHIFEIINADPVDIQDLKSKILLRFQTALEHYYKQDWQTARQLFEECLETYPDDKVSKLYIERIETFIKNPPPADWNGAYIATSK